jgi:hypothetical protein
MEEIIAQYSSVNHEIRRHFEKKDMRTKMRLRMHDVHSKLAAVCGNIETKCQ